MTHVHAFRDWLEAGPAGSIIKVSSVKQVLWDETDDLEAWLVGIFMDDGGRRPAFGDGTA